MCTSFRWKQNLIRLHHETFHIWASSQENLSPGFPTMRISKQSPQLPRLARKLKFACSKFRHDTFKYGNNKGADQTARMRRLVCAFVVCKPPKTGFLASRPIYLCCLFAWKDTLKSIVILEQNATFACSSFNLCRPVAISIKFVSCVMMFHWRVSCNFKKKTYYVSFSEDSSCLSKQCRPWWNFIWVFTVQKYPFRSFRST